jgi:hypothetical protein
MSSFVESRLVEAHLSEVCLDEEFFEVPLDEERLAEERLDEERLIEERLAEERLAEERFEEERLAEEFFDEEGFIDGSPDKAAQVLVNLAHKPIGHKVITMLQKCGGFRNEALLDSIHNVGIYDDDDYMDDYENYPYHKVYGWDRYDDFDVDDDWF